MTPDENAIGFWEQEAFRYSGNADYWRERYEAMRREARELIVRGIVLAAESWPKGSGWTTYRELDKFAEEIADRLLNPAPSPGRGDDEIRELIVRAIMQDRVTVRGHGRIGDWIEAKAIADRLLNQGPSSSALPTSEERRTPDP